MDRLLSSLDNALRTLFAQPHAHEKSPAQGVNEAALNDEQKKLAGALMRVNHVGEVCAQALYSAQALATKDEHLRQHLLQAAREETDHLAWTHERLQALGARPACSTPSGFQGHLRWALWLPR